MGNPSFFKTSTSCTSVNHPPIPPQPATAGAGTAPTVPGTTCAIRRVSHGKSQGSLNKLASTGSMRLSISKNLHT